MGAASFTVSISPLPPPHPRRSSAAAHGLLPSAASTTSVTGRPDLRGGGVNSPYAHTTPPSAPLCRAAEGSRCLSALWGGGGTLLRAGAFHLGATRLMAFVVTGGRAGNGPRRPRPCGAAPAGTRTGGREARGRGAAPSAAAGAAAAGADPEGLRGGGGPLGRNPPGAAGRHRNVTIIRRRPPGASGCVDGPPLPPQFCRGSTLLKGLAWPQFFPAPLSMPTPVK